MKKAFGLALVLLGALVLPAVSEEEGFEPIFNGKDLAGWDGNPELWRVEDGAITGQTTPEKPTKGNTFIIWRKGDVDDFELRLEFRIVGGNSGIQYRSKEGQPWVIGGYQADFDGAGQWAGTLYEERGRGILAKRGDKVVIRADGKKDTVGQTATEEEILEVLKKEGWNNYTIIAQGNHLQQILNGKVTVDVTDEQAEKRAMSGLLALQLHAGPPMKVQFKNIRIKRLKPSGENARSPNGKKKVVFVAGRPSHGYGAHEHNAGCLLLAKYLERAMPDFDCEVYRNGWPSEGLQAFEGADAVVVYCDGGGGHLLNPHIDEFQQVMDRGVGLVCLHYGVEVPQGKSGDAFLSWIGGYFEANWSVNPHWSAKFETFPEHPIARGVSPFEVNDEWYFHMRFRPELAGVTPILSAHPPASTMSRSDGPHSGNPDVRKAMANGEIQHMAWAAERPGGGRGFGFTGGHWHWNWGDDNFRKVALNAIVWAAHGQVPEDGVSTASPNQDDLEQNQDEPKPAEKKKTE